jgi:hypothetical protein
LFINVPLQVMTQRTIKTKTVLHVENTNYSKTVVSVIIANSQNGGEVVQNFTRLLDHLLTKLPDAKAHTQIYIQNFIK